MNAPTNHRHAPSNRPRPAPRKPRRTPEPERRAVYVPLVAGGQGRTAQEVAWSAEVVLVCVMTAGVLGLVIVLGHVAGWLT